MALCLLSDKKGPALSPDFSYPMLDALAAKAAGALLAKGLKRGALLALTAQTNWQTICLLFGAWRLSLTVALLPARLPPAALQHQLEKIKPSLFLEDLDALFHHAPFDGREIDSSALALLLLTSGSSGAPKIAAFTLRQLLKSAESIASFLSAKPQDRWLLSLPLHHVGGLGVLLRAFCSSGTADFEDKNRSYAERISPLQFASLIPTQLYRLLKEDFAPFETKLLIGGAPLAKSLYEKAKNRGLSLYPTYALTEMSSTVLCTHAPVWSSDSPFLGHPLPGREMKLVDGEIHVRGETLFEGYGYPPKKPIGWHATGDLGSYDERYGYTISGRKDFQFISGGENIQPEEIESSLLSHPDVEQAVVVPVRDEEFGERPAAYVKTTVDPSSLAAFLSDLLPKYKIPIAFFSLNESDALKPNRRQLIDAVNKIYPII